LKVEVEWDAATPDPADLEAVTADLDEARQIGVTDVPLFLLDRRLAVSGAQPVELLLQALEQAQPSRPERSTR
jgi:predicted DsbA family dithiol-disulfide isomerase